MGQLDHYIKAISLGFVLLSVHLFIIFLLELVSEWTYRPPYGYAGQLIGLEWIILSCLIVPCIFFSVGIIASGGAKKDRAPIREVAFPSLLAGTLLSIPFVIIYLVFIGFVPLVLSLPKIFSSEMAVFIIPAQLQNLIRFGFFISPVLLSVIVLLVMISASGGLCRSLSFGNHINNIK